MKKYLILFYTFTFLIAFLSAQNITNPAKDEVVKTSYQVRHLLQNINDDNYTESLEYRQIIESKSGTSTKAQAKKLEGFSAKPINQALVAADGTTVISVYYDRNLYTLTYADGVPDEAIDVPQSMSYRYGSIIPIDYFTSMNRPGYLFMCWTDGSENYSIDGTLNVVINKNISLTAQWIPLYYTATGVRSVNGNLSINPGMALMGEKISVTVNIDEGYGFYYLTAIDLDGRPVPLSVEQEGKRYSFIMPDSDVNLNLMCVYLFHHEATELPKGTDGTAGTDGRYLYFGDWPHDEIKSGVVLDSNHTVTMGSHSYYLGDDGNYYIQVLEKSGVAPRNEYQQNQQSMVARYYRVRPIKWRVLSSNYNESGNALLLAENILIADIPYYTSIFNRLLGDQILYANNYYYSNIRAYLNGYPDEYALKKGQAGRGKDWTSRGFLQSAFTPEAQSLIPVADIDNSTKSTGDAGGVMNPSRIYYCDNTQDKVFLLSEWEVTSEEYGFSSLSEAGSGNQRIRLSTPFAQSHSAYQNLTDGFGGFWWLRSPHFDCSYYVRVVGLSGIANYTNNVDETSIGIVPAILYHQKD